jgi:lysophospholipase L1-like esterase
MNIKNGRTCLYILLSVLCSFSFPLKEKIHVYLIGDSTMCLYEPSRAPLTGWGMPFAQFFDSSSVVIENDAKGGRSTRTFLRENRWSPIVANLKAGDYVLIQFGHNDEAKEEKYKDRYTPLPDYKNNLVKFITDSRNKGAFPILITPVSRMRFKDGVQQETHEEYTKACSEVANQYKVPLVDLDKKSRELYQQYGLENTKLLFMQLDPNENPMYPEGQKDNTHFNDYGARKIAELVWQGLKELRVPLVEFVNKK